MRDLLWLGLCVAYVILGATFMPALDRSGTAVTHAIVSGAVIGGTLILLLTKGSPS